MHEYSAASPTAISLPPTKPMDLSYLVEAALHPDRPASKGEPRPEDDEGPG
ncbi:hypothetical protein [Gryllotalpicola daejeonensis]|uniref:hypothetical protein n=1 Tax=Gryllotalpicola daejeonensis TaxID=993087 RepID=UPI0031D63B2F